MARIRHGRQEIEMKKMTKESNLLVTFSKRHSGLFTNASELCTLTGAEIASVVFSPGEKAFSFGSPSVEAVVDRFLSRRTIPENYNNNAALHVLNMELTNILNQEEIEKNKGDGFTEMWKERAKHRLWEKSTNELNLAELEKVFAVLAELRKDVATQIEVKMEGQGHNEGPYSMGPGHSGGGQVFPYQPFPQLPPPNMTGLVEKVQMEGQGPSRDPYFMGAGPSGGGRQDFPYRPFPADMNVVVEKVQMEVQGPSGGPFFMGAGPSGGGQVFPYQPFLHLPPPNMSVAVEKVQMEGQGRNGGPYFMGIGPSRGEQVEMAFPPQPLPQLPALEKNVAEWGLSLTPHGYTMAYGRGQGF